MLRSFTPLRLSVADICNAPLRTHNLLLTGNGNTTFTIDNLIPSTFIIREMILSGTGTVALRKSGNDLLVIPVNGTTAIPLQSYIPIVKGEGMEVSFSGTGNFTINLLGFLHTR